MPVVKQKINGLLAANLPSQVNGVDSMTKPELFRRVEQQFLTLPDHIKTAFVELHDDQRENTKELSDLAPLCCSEKLGELFPNLQLPELSQALTSTMGATRFSAIGKTVKGVFGSNSLCWNFGRSISVNDFASRISHSCRPNCLSRSHLEHPPFHTVVALRDIEPGEELSISYIHHADFPFYASPAAMRQRELASKLLECRSDGCVCRYLLPADEQRNGGNSSGQGAIARSDATCQRLQELTKDFDEVLRDLGKQADRVSADDGGQGPAGEVAVDQGKFDQAEKLLTEIVEVLDADRLIVPLTMVQFRFDLANVYSRLVWGLRVQRGAAGAVGDEGARGRLAERFKQRFEFHIADAESQAILLEGGGKKISHLTQQVQRMKTQFEGTGATNLG